MPEEALLDAAVESEPIEQDSGVTSDASETDAGDVSGDSSLVSEQDTPELKGSTLWRETKAALYSGKALTKPQISAIRRAIQSEAQITEKYPNGLGEVEQTLSAIRALAPEGMPVEQAIETIKADSEGFRKLSGQYFSADPAFVNDIAAASPEAFDNLAPLMIRQYAQSNPEGYTTQIAQSVVPWLDRKEFPVNFSILKAFLPQLQDGPAKDQVIQACEVLFGGYSDLKALAQKQIPPKALPQTQQQQNQPNNGVDPQIDLTRREWNLETIHGVIDGIISSAQKEVAGLRKAGLSEGEKKSVLAKVNEEVEARMEADKNFQRSMQASLRSGNKSAYHQLLKSKRDNAIPGAVRRAVEDVLKTRPAKVAAQPANGKQPATVLKPVQGATQFRKIAGPPKTQGMMVDLNRTPQSMLVKRQAYIKGEDRPVTWG